MRRVLLVAGRELGAIFGTPTAYVVLALFQLLAGIFFLLILNATSAVNLPWLYMDVGLVLLIMVPAVGMGAFVGELRSGTLELLLTSPLGAGELVLAKFLAHGLFVVLMVALTLQYPLALSVFAEVDFGRVAAGTLGCALLGLALLALSLLCSALVETQVAACLLCFALALALWCAESLGRLVTGTAGALLGGVSLFERLASFAAGVVDSADALFFALFVACTLRLCSWVVESRRWR